MVSIFHTNKNKNKEHGGYCNLSFFSGRAGHRLAKMLANCASGIAKNPANGLAKNIVSLVKLI